MCQCCVFLIIFVIIGAVIFFISSEGPSIDKNIKCDYRQYSAVCNREINWWKFQGNVSTSIMYLPKDHGLSISLMWDDTVIYNETVSARNPPPIFIVIPKVKTSAFSIQLHDVTFEDEEFHACLTVKAPFYWLFHRSEEIGCIDISMKKISQASVAFSSAETFFDFRKYGLLLFSSCILTKLFVI